LIIGTILKTNFSLSAFASGAELTKKSMSPFIIQEALDSPGCTLDEINMPFFERAFSEVGSLSLEVTVKNSTLLPARDLQSVLL